MACNEPKHLSSREPILIMAIEWLANIKKSIDGYIEQDLKRGGHTNLTIAYALSDHLESLVQRCQQSKETRDIFLFSDFLAFQKAVAADINKKFIPFIKLPSDGGFFTAGGKLFEEVVKAVFPDLFPRQMPIFRVSLDNQFASPPPSVSSEEVWSGNAYCLEKDGENLQKLFPSISELLEKIRNESVMFLIFLRDITVAEQYQLFSEGFNPQDSAKYLIACQSYRQKRITQLLALDPQTDKYPSLEEEIELFIKEQKNWLNANGKPFRLSDFFSFVSKEASKAFLKDFIGQYTQQCRQGNVLIPPRIIRLAICWRYAIHLYHIHDQPKLSWSDRRGNCESDYAKLQAKTISFGTMIESWICENVNPEKLEQIEHPCNFICDEFNGAFYNYSSKVDSYFCNMLKASMAVISGNPNVIIFGAGKDFSKCPPCHAIYSDFEQQTAQPSLQGSPSFAPSGSSTKP